MSQTGDPLRIVVWGTCDTGKPRVRILLRGLEQAGADIRYCHKDIWRGVEDKSGVAGWGKRMVFAFRWLASYPVLVARYLRLPSHDVVFVGYLGTLDVLVLWPFAKLRKAPIIWDAFLSLYNTVVEDRRLIGRRNPLAHLLYGWEWLACRGARLVILDTETHSRYFRRRFGLQQGRTADVIVGAETEIFHPAPENNKQEVERSALSVLFYGQFIPLHGIETIVQAAARLENYPFEWWLVGRGQEAEKIRALLGRHPLPKLTWIPWVPYAELPGRIHRADVCLGIFGATEKADMVIPNKVFQILAAGKPLITRDSSAIRELLEPDMPGIQLIPPADPGALADAILRFWRQGEPVFAPESRQKLLNRIEPATVGRRLLTLANQVVDADTDMLH